MPRAATVTTAATAIAAAVFPLSPPTTASVTQRRFHPLRHGLKVFKRVRCRYVKRRATTARATAFGSWSQTKTIFDVGRGRKRRGRRIAVEETQRRFSFFYSNHHHHHNNDSSLFPPSNVPSCIQNSLAVYDVAASLADAFDIVLSVSFGAFFLTAASSFLISAPAIGYGDRPDHVARLHLLVRATNHGRGRSSLVQQQSRQL